MASSRGRMGTPAEIEALAATRTARIGQYRAAIARVSDGVTDHVVMAMLALDTADRAWLRARGVLPPLPGDP